MKIKDLKIHATLFMSAMISTNAYAMTPIDIVNNDMVSPPSVIYIDEESDMYNFSKGVQQGVQLSTNNILNIIDVIEEKNIELKEQIILERDNYSFNELQEMSSIVLAEAYGAGTNYEDAYGVMSCALNRTHSKKWNDEVEKFYEKGSGKNIYYQLILPNQFTSNPRGKWYEKFLHMDIKEKRNLPGYKAVIECLYTKEPIHDYLNYLAAELSGDFQLVSGGNWYSNKLTEKDTLNFGENIKDTNYDLFKKLVKTL